MKNRTITILTILLAALLFLTACGKTEPEGGSENGDDGEFTYEIGGTTAEAFDYWTADLTPYVEIGDLSGLTVTKEAEELTDEEFEEEIAAMLDSYSYFREITDRAVEEGETVRADYTGYKNGVAFATGTATDQEIVAADGTGYVEGFASAFIGQFPGEEFRFDITFPEDYGNEELAGQEVTFICTIDAIVTDEYVTPELTDEFVAEQFNYNNAEEFRIAYRSMIQERKTYYVNNNVYTDLWAEVLERVTVKAYPEEEVERIYNETRQMYELYASYYQTDYETFLSSYMNTTDEQLRADAQSFVKEDLSLYQLLKTYGMTTLSDEDYQTEAGQLAEYNGWTLEEMEDYYGADTLRTSILWQKLMEKLAETATILEP